MKTTLFFLPLLFLLLTGSARASRADPKASKPKGSVPTHGPQPAQPGPVGGDPGGIGYFGPGGGFGIPGFGPGWAPGVTGGGYGYGSGSPSGGHSKSGTVRPTVVCKAKGPCYMKKLRCPAKCFSSFSRSGKGYGGGGGGGGCTMDCTKSCTAYC